MREVIISNPKNDSFGTQLLSLYETLKGAQAHEKLVFNFSKLKWACPSLILPLSAYIKETGSSYNLAGSPIKSYFDAINFPRGINSISRFEAEERKNRTYTPISILKKEEKEKTVFALPETFMNKSGLAVSTLAKFYKVKPARIFAVHDDIDLPVGKIKVSFARSSAGHKGVEHIIKNLKTNEFYRLRVGIGQKKKTKQAMEIVLKKFSTKEADEIKKVIKKTCDAIICAISESPQKAMTIYNQ